MTLNEIIYEYIVNKLYINQYLTLFLIKILSIILSTLIIIVILYILIKIFKLINHKINKLNEEMVSKSRLDTIVSLIDNLIKYITIIIGMVLILLNLGISYKIILTSAGAISVIIGIAGQELIKDFIQGIFTVIEGYYDIGDYIEISKYEGTVHTLGVKTTTLLTNSNEIVTIPNSTIVEIKNYSKRNIIIFYEIYTKYEEDINIIIKLLSNNIVPAIKEDLLIHSADYMGIEALDLVGVKHMIKVSCDPKERYQVKRNINLIIKEEFEKQKISLPKVNAIYNISSVNE